MDFLMLDISIVEVEITIPKSNMIIHVHHISYAFYIVFFLARNGYLMKWELLKNRDEVVGNSGDMVLLG